MLIKSFAFQSLNGLNHIHKNGFFHRDMKPENLLVSDKNELKIADFGLAKLIRSVPPFTDYVSTRWYRAPELLLKSETYNGKVDIFGLGCIIVEMYLLAPLFPGENEIDQLNKIISVLGTPPKEWVFAHKQAARLGIRFRDCEKVGMRSLIPHASYNSIDLIEKMLTYDPVKRVSTSEALKHPFFTESIRTSYLGNEYEDGNRSLETNKNNRSDVFGRLPKQKYLNSVKRTDIGDFDADDSFGMSPSPERHRNVPEEGGSHGLGSYRAILNPVDRPQKNILDEGSDHELWGPKKQTINKSKASASYRSDITYQEVLNKAKSDFDGLEDFDEILEPSFSKGYLQPNYTTKQRGNENSSSKHQANLKRDSSAKRVPDFGLEEDWDIGNSGTYNPRSFLY